MGLSELSVRLLLLFFPGVICYFVVESLIVHRERKPYEVLIHSYVYGLLSYFLYAMVRSAYSAFSGFKIADDGAQVTVPLPKSIRFSQALTDGNAAIDFFEIGLVTLTSVFAALFIAYAINHKWLSRVARRYGITKKFGDHDVWSFIMNSGEVKWANVRDLPNKLLFSGYIYAFSDDEDSAELLLTDVIVYNEVSGEQLYRADRMYLSRQIDELTIEFPDPTPQNGALNG